MTLCSLINKNNVTAVKLLWYKSKNKTLWDMVLLENNQLCFNSPVVIL